MSKKKKPSKTKFIVSKNTKWLRIRPTRFNSSRRTCIRCQSVFCNLIKPSHSFHLYYRRHIYPSSCAFFSLNLRFVSCSCCRRDISLVDMSPYAFCSFSTLFQNRFHEKTRLRETSSAETKSIWKYKHKENGPGKQ